MFAATRTRLLQQPAERSYRSLGRPAGNREQQEIKRRLTLGRQLRRSVQLQWRERERERAQQQPKQQQQQRMLVLAQMQPATLAVVAGASFVRSNAGEREHSLVAALAAGKRGFDLEPLARSAGRSVGREPEVCAGAWPLSLARRAQIKLRGQPIARDDGRLIVPSPTGRLAPPNRRLPASSAADCNLERGRHCKQQSAGRALAAPGGPPLACWLAGCARTSGRPEEMKRDIGNGLAWAGARARALGWAADRDRDKVAGGRARVAPGEQKSPAPIVLDSARQKDLMESRLPLGRSVGASGRLPSPSPPSAARGAPEPLS